MPTVPKRKIKFNPDKTVDVTSPGGKTLNFSQDEYKRYNEQIQSDDGTKNLRTPTTPNVKEGVAIQKSNEQARDVAAGKTPVLATPQVNQQGLQTQPTIQPEAPNIPLGYEVLPGTNVIRKIPMTAKQRQQELSPLSTISSGLSGIGSTEQGGLILTEAATIIDLIRSGITNKQSTKAVIATNQFNDLSSALNLELSLVASGQKSAVDAETLITQAEAAVQDLEDVAKREGKINLRYWLSDGRELSSEIILQKSKLNSFKIQLGNIKAQSAAVQQALTLQ